MEWGKNCGVGGKGGGSKYLSLHVYMRGSREGVGGVEGVRTSPEICKADITGNEKNRFFFISVHFHSYTSKLPPPPLEKFSGSAPALY